MSLERINITHNTDEWLNYRNTGIGGSDAAAIAGVSPFKTNIQVWEEKTGKRTPEDISDHPNVKYGTEAEDLLFKLFKLDHPEYQCKADKHTVYRRGFMFASLDGELTETATGRKGIYEGKTTEIHQRINLDKWDRRVPDYYYTQLLHYLIVTNRDFAVLKAQLKLYESDGNIELITRHYKFERSEMMEDMRYLYIKEKEFWECVEKNERPALILPSI